MTPNITGAIASLDDALLAVIDAKRHQEAPHIALDVCLVSMRDARAVLAHHEKNGHRKP